MVSARRTTASNGVVLEKTVMQSFETKSILQENSTSTPFAYVKQQSTERRDLSGDDLGKKDVFHEYDAWGNQTRLTETTTLAGKEFKSDTIASYYTNETNWCIGDPKQLDVTKTADGTSITRTTAYTYDSLCDLASETVEPNDPTIKLTKMLDRTGNAFGLVGKETVTWRDPQTQTDKTRTVTRQYDALGRFMTSTTNAAGHTATMVNDPRTGALTSATDPNGLVTTYGIDGFGRKMRETSPDGNETHTLLVQCDATCPAGATSVKIVETKRGTVRTAVPVLSYLDSAGHVIQTETWGLNGEHIVAETKYNERGLEYQTYWPRGDNSAAVLQKTTEYDELSRPTTVTMYAEDASPAASTTSYNGPTITLTNPLGKAKTETRDGWGRLQTAVDAMGGSTGYSYDPFDNLKKVVDPLGNAVEVTYDKLGRRTELKDPDLGYIQYYVDPIGHVYKQVNPKQRAAGQVTTFDYDALGRMVSRVEPDLLSYWKYDIAEGQTACSPTKSCGDLVETYTMVGSTKDYRRVQTYDSYGRPDKTTTYLDVVYTTQVQYDEWGRTIRQLHQRGTAAAKTIDNRYNGYGYLYRIERGSMLLWQATQQDAANRVTSAVLGNGLFIERSFNTNTGRLANGILKDASGASKLTEGYEYDAVGNVTKRTQYWPDVGFQEDFTYDDLNRLQSSAIGIATSTFTYSATGNIISKTGVGTGSYVYPSQGPGSVRPHAVSSIPGIGSFTYDANGNMESGNGRTITWTSFDMPLKITGQFGVWSSFAYGTDHQRTRQTKSDGTVVYYAGAMEVETKSGIATVKTYWPSGLGVEIETNGTTELNWTHLDRLGSVVAISGADGMIKEKLAYDNWGKRRNLIDNGTPNSIDGVTDNKGFTGHEMLDGLDLVHMNGRVYDPVVARFISADPIIQDPTHSQSYNRYTYVWNNPTNLTDPSGFMAAGECDQRCEETRRRHDRCEAAGSLNCEWYGPTGYEGSTDPVTNSNDNSGGNGKASLHLYRVAKVGEQWVQGEEVYALGGINALNGLLNELARAVAVMGEKVSFEYPNAQEFVLVHNPTQGFLRDAVESARDKMGITSPVARQLAGLLRDAQERGQQTHWIVHSQGGLIFTEAVRYNGRALSSHEVTYIAGANNRLMTRRILADSGVHLRGFRDHPADFVPKGIGLNANPLEMVISLLASPALFMNENLSPHTLVCRTCPLEQ